jgi:hypothetical protein
MANPGIVPYCHEFRVTIDGSGLVIEFTEPLANLTKNKYDSLTVLQTPKITVNTAQSSQCAVFTSRLVTDPNNVLIPYSRSSRLVTVSQLTHCFNCRLSTDSH